MTDDELMVYSAMALVPIISGITAFFLIRAIRLNILSLVVAYILFVVAIVAAMLMSFTVVLIFSSLLHGDGALAIIAAPITGAILTVPVVIIFIIVLLMDKYNNDKS